MNVGAQVKLQTVDGCFEGIVHALNRREQFVTLRDGKCYIFTYTLLSNSIFL